VRDYDEVAGDLMVFVRFCSFGDLMARVSRRRRYGYDHSAYGWDG
jgi:hypothetical protein